MLQAKSEENFKAIDILIASKTYSVAVHCAYYSSLQLVMHYVLSYAVKSEDKEEFINNVKKGASSHITYINSLTDEVKRIDRTAAADIYKALNSFKAKRNSADYDLNEIKEDDAKKSHDFAKQINSFLINFFNNGKITNISTRIV